MPEQEDRQASPWVYENPLVPTYYTNSLNVLQAPYDFVISISRIFSIDEEGVHSELLARLMMSPQHAKAFAEILSQKVRDYEEIFGPLPDKATMESRILERRAERASEQG